MKRRQMRIALIVGFGLLGISSSAVAADKKVKVFILAGQSNMEGHGQVRSLPHLGNHPKYGHLLKTLKGPDGKWAVRDDVTISYKAEQRKKRSGPLTVGWGGEGRHWRLVRQADGARAGAADGQGLGGSAGKRPWETRAGAVGRQARRRFVKQAAVGGEGRSGRQTGPNRPLSFPY